MEARRSRRPPGGSAGRLQLGCPLRLVACVAFSFKLLMVDLPSLFGRALCSASWPVCRPRFARARKGGSETRQGLSFPEILEESASPAEKFSRPLRGRAVLGEHAGIKAAGGSGPRWGRSDNDGGGHPVTSMFRFRERMVSGRRRLA